MRSDCGAEMMSGILNDGDTHDEALERCNANIQ